MTEVDRRHSHIADNMEFGLKFDNPTCLECGGKPEPLTREDITVSFEMRGAPSGGYYYTGVVDVGDTPDPEDIRARCGACRHEWSVRLLDARE